MNYVIINTALPINADNVGRFFEVKKEHCRVWKIIGTELGIDMDMLNAIEKDHTDDVDRLHAMIDTANPAPTHAALAKVLQSANITSAIAGTIM